MIVMGWCAVQEVSSGPYRHLEERREVAHLHASGSDTKVMKHMVFL